MIGTGIPSPDMLLFNGTIRALLSQIGREPINTDKDDKYYETLISRQETYLKNKDSTFLPQIYSSCSEGRWGSMDAWSDYRRKQQ